jgi:Zn-finger nucleic acid-binding protein
MNCARCGSKAKLKPEFYEGVEIDRCPSCKGVWLDDKELTKIVSLQQEKFSTALIDSTLKAAFKGVTEEEKKTKEHCPKCSEIMHPVNYSYSSGIVIDRCPQAHGVWLDFKELEKIQSHGEHWEKEKQSKQLEWKKLVQSAADNQIKENIEKNKSSGASPIAFLLGKLSEYL